jgi:hypothetical protein
MFRETPIYDMLMWEMSAFGYVLEECEHGLRKDLCEGPQHYPMDRWDDEPPF